MAGVGLDFLTQIVNVQWGGGTVFVAGGNAEFVLYAKIKSKGDLSTQNPVFQDLGHLGAFTIQGHADSWPAANVGAGSCREIIDNKGERKIIFILGGNDAVVDDATLTSGSGSVVMVSHNGKDWTKAFRKQWPDYYGNDSSVQAFAYDKDKGQFYGYVPSTEYYFLEPDHRIEFKNYERSLTSSDGKSWGEAGAILRYDSDGNPPPNLSPPGLFMPHLNPKAKLPDGKFGYYEIRNDGDEIVESYLAVPTKFDDKWYLSDSVVFSDDSGNRYGSSVTITILKDGETTTSTHKTPITYVTCVAYASGIYMAGGATGDRAQIAASVDDGETWKVVWDGPDNFHQVINTITGASLAAA